MSNESIKHKTCFVCKNNEVAVMLDLGAQPACNRFLKSAEEDGYQQPLTIGLCKHCGLVQLTNPFPVTELQPEYNWVTYTEPEDHLDSLATKLSKLSNIDKSAKIFGISYKDDSLLERMKKLGFDNAMRFDLKKDSGINSDNLGVETIQNVLTYKLADKIVKQNGKFDLIIARHILEHTSNIFEFMKGVRTLLNQKGHVLFEVPDYMKAFEQFDYSTIWEEHTLYFTPYTFKNCLLFGKFSIEKFDIHQYPIENSLVAIVKPADKITTLIDKNVLQKEIARALTFSQEFVKKKATIKSLFFEYNREKGKIAIFGAGHSSCLLVNILGLKDEIECIIDDNPNKQGLFMPGSHLPILSPSAFLNDNIKLCILSVNPNFEEKVIAKNKHFIENGGKFLSFCPASEISLYTYLKHLNGTNFKEINKEVYYATDKIVKLGRNDINLFKKKLIHNQLQKIRLCTHKDTTDRIHEMFIILGRNIYIRPHKHLNKAESFHVIEGTANIVIFDEEGKILEVMEVSDYNSGNKFYYKIYEPYYHTVCVISSFLVFQETTSGPFNKSDTVYAPWAPEEKDVVAVKAYMEKLAKSVDSFLKNKGTKK